MTTKEKIEKRGYKVSYLSGYRDGEQCIIGCVAEKNNRKTEAKNITALFNSLIK